MYIICYDTSEPVEWSLHFTRAVAVREAQRLANHDKETYMVYEIIEGEDVKPEIDENDEDLNNEMTKEKS